MKTRTILASTILTCLAASGLAIAQPAFTKVQVGDRIRKVEDGVDEFRKWSEKRVEEGKTPAQAAKGSGRTRGKTATDSQKAAANEKKDDLDGALSDSGQLLPDPAGATASSGRCSGRPRPSRAP